MHSPACNYRHNPFQCLICIHFFKNDHMSAYQRVTVSPEVATVCDCKKKMGYRANIYRMRTQKYFKCRQTVFWGSATVFFNSHYSHLGTVVHQNMNIKKCISRNSQNALTYCMYILYQPISAPHQTFMMFTLNKILKPKTQDVFLWLHHSMKWKYYTTIQSDALKNLGSPWEFSIKLRGFEQNWPA